MKQRLVAQGHVDQWSAEVSKAMQAASDRMRRSVAQQLTAHGLTWDTPARSSPATLFDPSAWAAAVAAEVTPVAQRIARTAWNAARGKLPQRAVAGAPNPVDRLTAMIVDRAMQGGSGISRRMGTLAVTAAGVDMDAVRAKINAAPTLPLHPTNQPTIASAYQAAYKAVDQLVANTTAHLSDAATALLGETAQANLGATISHTWNSAFAETSRPDHMDADGQEQDAGDPFSIGDESLMFPGDPDGSDEQIC
ncbi:MAG TPA: hypothetical protein VMH24_08450, partial [Candidatus Sulfotelmatobacter sp.]|nr:hypothetical protein [Candidatus Sulfotelmatobacter sp.]